MEEVEVKVELTPEEREAEKYGVSLEQYKLLEKLVSKLGKVCGWDTKKKTNREMKKFAGMVADGEAFRVDDFLRDNKLDEFPEEASKILNELEVEFAYKQVGKPKKVFVPEKIVPTKKKEKKKEEKKTARKTFTKTTLTREELLANPVEGVMQSLRQN
jgi:transcriptional regulator of met regulon